MALERWERLYLRLLLLLLLRLHCCCLLLLLHVRLHLRLHLRLNEGLKLHLRLLRNHVGVGTAVKSSSTQTVEEKYMAEEEA